MISFRYDGTKIAALRKAKGWSMAELARRTSIKQPSLWALEHQVTKKPRAETLMRIASALGVPLSKLMDNVVGNRTSADDLIAVHVGLTPENRQALLAAAEALLNSQKRR